MANFTLTRAIAAPPEVVFDTITDHPSYPEFTPIRRAVLEREGEGAANGVGAIRALHVLGPPIRERVLDYRRPDRFSYEVLSGVPVRSQVGTVTIEASPGGSVMRYELEVEPLLPGTGAVVSLVAKAAIGRLMAGVAAEAERRARG
jgi:uncharacterized protein YndB with AHSA1/START domain